MTNFGYETIGSTVNHSIEGYIRGCSFSTSTAGVADSITVALAYGTAYTGNIKCAIYLADYSFVGATEERNIELTDTATWYVFNFTGTKPSLTASTGYILCVWGQATTGTAFIAYNSGANTRHYQAIAYTGNFPDPYVPNSTQTALYSIYCTYSVAGQPYISRVQGVEFPLTSAPRRIKRKYKQRLPPEMLNLIREYLEIKLNA